jgi:hypothetical protein
MATGLTTVATATEAKPAHADTPNYGDWLSGKDPIETGCADDARTLSTTVINKSGGSLGITLGPLTAETPSQNEEVGTISLQYSEECGTYWNTTRTKDPNDITYIGVEKNDGYRQQHSVNGAFPGTPAFNGHTDMIYGRGENDEFRAYVWAQPLWDITPNNTGTYFTSGPQVPKS